MADIGRNDPCPCGSGKKYKKCCLLKEAEFQGRRRDEGSAVGTALAWLSEYYPEAVDRAIREDYLGELADAEIDALEELSPELRGMLDVNIGEWLLADAIFDVDGEDKRAGDLLFAPGGPILPAQGRQWLEAIGERPMGLYEVVEAKPGEGLRLQDTLRPGKAPVWVRERSASRSLVQWDTLGARLAIQDGEWVLTGAVYPLSRDVANECRDEILQDMRGADWDSDLARDLIGATISAYWLETLLTVEAPPEWVDASTREPLMLTTEHYRVKEWSGLEEVLAQQPDVEGSREDDWVWFAELEGDMRRARAALNVRKPNGLEVFCRTIKLADEARAWLEGIAGRFLEHRTREVVDPRFTKARETDPTRRRERLPPQLESELVHQFLRKHYENWAEEPIPALGNRTPRESVRTAKGRQAVADLLKSYEQKEARRARQDGTPVFEFGFLWERLGLKRDV